MLCLITQLCPTLCDPMDCSPPGSSVHGILQERILEWVAMPSSRRSSQPRSPALQADSLPSEPPGEPKNTGVDSLPVFKGIFLTQESNWGLLYCRQILYQMSYQGSPTLSISFCKVLNFRITVIFYMPKRKSINKIKMKISLKYGAKYGTPNKI